MDWKTDAGAAATDLQAALETDDPVEALSHLRDAVENLENAIEELEGDEEEDEEEVEED